MVCAQGLTAPMVVGSHIESPKFFAHTRKSNGNTEQKILRFRCSLLKNKIKKQGNNILPVKNTKQRGLN